MSEGSNKDKEVMIENIQSIDSGLRITPESSPEEAQEKVNTTMPIIKMF